LRKGEGAIVNVVTYNPTATFLGRLLDRRDERLARQRRGELGHCRKLVSWQRLSDRRWRARLSCEEWPETIERAGRTRCEAIERAEHALQLVFAGQLDRAD
jgi:hypothetical protein